MTSYRHLTKGKTIEMTGKKEKPKILTRFKANLVLLASLLFILSANSASSLSISANKTLEGEIKNWLALEGVNSDLFTIQVNDSRLQVPFCDSKFKIELGNKVAGALSRTVKVSCPGSDWNRIIRLKTKPEPLEKIRQKTSIATTTALVAEGPINQYAKITRDQLVQKEIPNNRLPPNVLKESHALTHSFAKRALRAGHIVTTADLISPKQVVVLKTSVPAHTVIKRQSFSMEYRLKGIPNDAITSLEGLDNLASNRLLHPGDVLRKRDLSKAKLVKRGDLVLVEAKSNEFQIVNEAIAFQDGYLGDQIKLTSVDSKREIQATVVGQGKVSALSKKWIIK